jgi:mRNA interferase MazF
VVSAPQRGEVWWGELEGVGRRPFLVLTRDAAIPVLASLVCAPITRTVRSIPTELPLGTDDGMPVACAATFDNLRTIPKHALTERIAQLSPNRVGEACRALRIAVDC